MAGHERAELSATNQEWQVPPPSQAAKSLLYLHTPSPTLNPAHHRNRYIH